MEQIWKGLGDACAQSWMNLDGVGSGALRERYMAVTPVTLRQ